MTRLNLNTRLKTTHYRTQLAHLFAAEFISYFFFAFLNVQAIIDWKFIKSTCDHGFT